MHGTGSGPDFQSPLILACMQGSQYLLGEAGGKLLLVAQRIDILHDYIVVEVATLVTPRCHCTYNMPT